MLAGGAGCLSEIVVIRLRRGFCILGQWAKAHFFFCLHSLPRALASAVVAEIQSLPHSRELQLLFFYPTYLFMLNVALADIIPQRSCCKSTHA